MHSQSESKKHIAEPPKFVKKMVKTQSQQIADDQNYSFKITHFSPKNKANEKNAVVSEGKDAKNVFCDLVNKNGDSARVKPFLGRMDFSSSFKPIA